MAASLAVAVRFRAALGLTVGTVLLGTVLTAIVITYPGCTVAGVPDAGGPGGDGGDGGTNGGANGNAKSVFAIIGDYGDDDDNSRAMSELVKGWNPDFIITVGDNDYSDGAFRGTFDGLELGVGQYFHEFIGNYQGTRGAGSDVNRFFPTPGDHCWGDTCDDPGGLDDYLAYFTLPSENSGNERYYDFRQGDIHFFAVHAIDGCEVDGVTSDSVQGNWVRDAALASDAPFKIAYFHKPAYSSGDRHEGEGAHMRWPWADWGFDMVLAGDDHVYERIERDGIRYIVNGLGGVDIHGFRSIPETGSQVRFADDYGAIRVDVFDGGMQVSFITVGGVVVDTFDVGTPDTTGTDGGTDGGGATELDPEAPPVTMGNWYRPGVETRWQWQLQPDANGAINTTYDVEVYDIDLFDAEASVISDLQASGRRVICYFSAGSFEAFRDDAGAFMEGDLGSPLEGFANERWLDVRSGNVHDIMRARLDVAVEKDCDGVEPDNVDGYQNNPGFPLTATDQLAFNRFLANEAHERGLSVGLKNDLDQISELVDYFDFSVNEQCHEFSECDALRPFIEAGKPVFNAEYADTFVSDAAAQAGMCADAMALGIRSLILSIDLDDSLRISCDQ